MAVWVRRAGAARQARGTRRAWGNRRAGLRGRANPFRTLEVQLALSRLDREIARLEAGDTGTFAQGHHLRAALLAYEQVLAEACRLAGIPVPPLPEGRCLRRLLAEAELRARGWSW